MIMSMCPSDQEAPSGPAETHKSPSPCRKAQPQQVNSEKDGGEPSSAVVSPLNSDSGYFEGGIESEPSIEIIFDKNASNNNSGSTAAAGKPQDASNSGKPWKLILLYKVVRFFLSVA